MAVVTTDQQRLAVISIKKERGEALTKDDIMSVKCLEKRQKLIRENRSLFEKKKWEEFAVFVKAKYSDRHQGKCIAVPLARTQPRISESYRKQPTNKASSQRVQYGNKGMTKGSTVMSADTV